MKLTVYLSAFALAALFACNRDRGNGAGPDPRTRLGYGDSLFYLKSSNYTVLPRTGAGTYTAFPDNLNIDRSTGAITVSLKGRDGESQTGMRYLVRYTPATGAPDSTYITIAGIGYVDRFYRLAQNDSIIAPIYNADGTKALPAGSYNISADNKLALNDANGKIDIKETVRRGFFDNTLNASWKQTTIRYRTADGSDATNSIDIILYYYNTLADVPVNVSALMQAHQRLLPGLNAPAVPTTTGPVDNNLSSSLSLSKPRPPCIVIIAH